MARPSNTEERQQQIVEGLLRVMAERGYDQASIAEIAHAAGLSAGLVHYHFENKQQILVALVELLATRLRARHAARLKHASNSPRARLHAFIDAHLATGDGADPQAVACWVAIGAEATRKPEVRVVYESFLIEAHKELERLLEEALRENGRKTSLARAFATGLMAAIEGSYRLAIAAPSIVPTGFAAPSVRRMADGLIDAKLPKTPVAR